MSSGHRTGFDFCLLLCDIRQIVKFLFFFFLRAEDVDNACIPSRGAVMPTLFLMQCK